MEDELGNALVGSGGALAELDGFASPQRALVSGALPMKRPTPSNREFVRPSSQRRSSSSRDGSGKVDRKLPGSGASSASIASGPLGASEPPARAGAELPTPDCQAFQRLGQLRRRSRSSTPLGSGPQSFIKSATPSHAVCPPTPQRTGTARKGASEVAAAAATAAAAAPAPAPAPAPGSASAARALALPGYAPGTSFRSLAATPTRERRSPLYAEKIEVLFNAAASQPSRFPVQKKRTSKFSPGGKAKKVASSPGPSPCSGAGAGAGAGAGSSAGSGGAGTAASTASRSEIPELRFVEAIGAGTFAAVSVVREVRSGRLFALKENSKRFESHQAKSFMQYKRATLAWASLAPHLNVVPIYCAWVEPGFLRIQMELCRGGTLLHYVDWCMLEAGPCGSGSGRSSLSSMSTDSGSGGWEASPWDEAQMWRCLGDAAAGLEQVHRSGLCHNDVKPGNMFLGGDGSPGSPRRVMIGDFGNLRRCHEQLEGDEGDFKYLSKDALEGGRATTAADVFSLGISFYEVVADVVLPEVGMWHQLREGMVPPLPARNAPAPSQGLEGPLALQPPPQQQQQQQQRRLQQQQQQHQLLFQPRKEALAGQRVAEDQLYALLCRMMDTRPQQRPTASEVLAHPMVQLHRGTPLREYSPLFLGANERAGTASRDRSLTPVAGSSSSSGMGVFVTTPLAESLKRDVGSFDARGMRTPVPSVQTALFFPLSRTVVTPESSPVHALPLPQQLLPQPQPQHEEDPRRVLDFDDC